MKTRDHDWPDAGTQASTDGGLRSAARAAADRPGLDLLKVFAVAVANEDAALGEIRKQPGKDESTGRIVQIATFLVANENEPAIGGAPRRDGCHVLDDDVVLLIGAGGADQGVFSGERYHTFLTQGVEQPCERV